MVLKKKKRCVVAERALKDGFFSLSKRETLSTK
jgi:hypothetical protein